MAEINPTQLRNAVAWSTNQTIAQEEDGRSPWEWFWEAIQGDFNDNRSTGQIVVDAAISMIPLVDQVCDVRDLIANCKKLREDASDTWAWVALGLTLIGLLPLIGSLVKGVLKVFFAFVRRKSLNALPGAVDGALTWVVALLRREACQRYLRQHKVDEVFFWLAKSIKNVKAKNTPAGLLSSFDKGIRTTEALAKKVEHIPRVGPKAKDALEKIHWVRARADEGLGQACDVINKILEAIIMRLQRESLRSLHGIVDVKNIHYRGVLPESTAVTLMRNLEVVPPWLSRRQDAVFKPINYLTEKSDIDEKVKEGWPSLTEKNVTSFHKLVATEIKGPARLFRIISPNSRAMSDCWISEKIFDDIENSPDPRAAWRKFLAVWPDWNGNGQFVVYDVKPGETLKAWKGPAASQTRDTLPDNCLEGGWEQIVITIERSDPRNDIMQFFKKEDDTGGTLKAGITRAEYDKLPESERLKYLEFRTSINHPNISGPFETGWGYTDFDGQGLSDRIGLPALPGQITALAK